MSEYKQLVFEKNIKGYLIMIHITYWPINLKQIVGLSLSFDYYVLAHVWIFGIGAQLQVFNLNKDDTAIEAIKEVANG